MFVNKSSVENDPEYRVKLKKSNARHYFILVSLLMMLAALLALCAGNFAPTITMFIATLFYAVSASIITDESLKTVLLNSCDLYKFGFNLIFNDVRKLISTR